MICSRPGLIVPALMLNFSHTVPPVSAIQLSNWSPVFSIIIGRMIFKPFSGLPKSSAEVWRVSFASFGTTVKFNVALREKTASTAWIVCIPKGKLSFRTRSTSKLPVLLTGIAVFGAVACATCPVTGICKAVIKLTPSCISC